MLIMVDASGGGIAASGEVTCFCRLAQGADICTGERATWLVMLQCGIGLLEVSAWLRDP